MMKYRDKLRNAVEASHSCLCVGLDPHLHMFPGSLNEQFPDPNERVVRFLERVIEVTAPHCAAYKPNLAFFEALGEEGLRVFGRVLNAVPDDKIVIADAKRGDIGSTAENYKKAFFDYWDVDAVTLNPLMGFETLDSYFGYSSKALYVLTLTSNPGASDFFEQPFSEFPSMAAYIASTLSKRQHDSQTRLGMVVGATRPGQLTPVLKLHSGAPLLIPGIGKQGGKIEDLITALDGHRGISLVSSSRSILFAGGDQQNWEPAVENKVKQYKELLTPITEYYV